MCSFEFCSQSSMITFKYPRTVRKIFQYWYRSTEHNSRQHINIEYPPKREQRARSRREEELQTSGSNCVRISRKIIICSSSYYPRNKFFVFGKWECQNVDSFIKKMFYRSTFTTLHRVCVQASYHATIKNSQIFTTKIARQEVIMILKLIISEAKRDAQSRVNR